MTTSCSPAKSGLSATRLIKGLPTDQMDGAIAISTDGGGLITPVDEIRGALDEKKDKYGKPNAPLVIVVADCRGELSGGDRDLEALFEALFGKTVQAVASDFHRPEGGRAAMTTSAVARLAAEAGVAKRLAAG